MQPMSTYWGQKTRLALIAAPALLALLYAQPGDQLWQHRNLGKAFYENPTTQKEAVEEFRKALALAPNSIREQVNFGLALLRAGDIDAGIAQLQKVQKLDPKLPHTWFNLGIELQKKGDFDQALEQFRGMIRLVPDEPASHYHIGALLKLKGDIPSAIQFFEKTRDLNPRLAAPHFQLYGLYRQQKRAEEAAAELRIFQQIKKENEGAAVPEDMDWSFYSEIHDPLDAPGNPQLTAPVYRTEKLAEGFLTTPGVASLPDGIIAWSAERVALFHPGDKQPSSAGLDALRGVTFIAPADFDNDALIDLAVLTKTQAALYHNPGKSFVKQSTLAEGEYRKALWLDFDHDYDLDLFLIGDSPRLLRNNGAAGFSDETKRFPFHPGQALDIVRFDIEPDTPGFDMVVTYRDRTGILYRDLLGGNYKAVPIDALPPGATGLLSEDLNHDGRTDLATPELTLLNLAGKFQRTTAPSPPPTAAFVANGRLHPVTIKDGELTVSRDVTPDYGNWIEIALAGVKNQKLAVAAEVEIKAGAFYKKIVCEGVPVPVRLGKRDLVDTIRITWPNGLVQNEPKVAVNKIVAIKEAPRLSGSCPMIFTWNGERFEFITDVLGVAPLGASSADGQYFPVDHDEYVTIPAGSLKARNGKYEIRVTEELREVSYIDQIKLIAVDHPAGTDIVTNEKFKAPPFPEFKLYGVTNRVYPTGIPALRHRDAVYAANAQAPLDLDFPAAAPSNRALLVLNGWVDWADGSTFLAAAQERKPLTFPSLQVRNTKGEWQTVIEDMGMPAGKPKTIAVDLTGKFLSTSREVRIVTNLCVYWDEIFLVDNHQSPRTRLTSVPLSNAGLRFRGFSKVTVHPERKQPERFDYQAVSYTSMWNPTPGLYTRYGPVGDLLATPDDRMVIMGSGDEMALEFDASALPPLPAAWKRDFLLLVGGWAKDADANTAFSQTVLPLPFQGMKSYPSDQPYPASPANLEYLKKCNTRPALRLLRPLTEPRPKGAVEVHSTPE